MHLVGLFHFRTNNLLSIHCICDIVYRNVRASSLSCHNVITEVINIIFRCQIRAFIRIQLVCLISDFVMSRAYVFFFFFRYCEHSNCSIVHRVIRIRVGGVHDRLHIYPLCGVVYFPWHRHQIEGANGVPSSKIHRLQLRPQYKAGSALCSPVPMFPGTYVPRYLCSPVPMFCINR